MHKLTYSVDKDGYFRVALTHKDGTRKSIGVHRIIALTFLENKNNYPVVNHIDHNKQNNNVINLEWCTISYNTKDGYNYHNYHFTKKIKAINLINGNFQTFNSVKECAEYFKISYFDVSKIANKKICPHKYGKIAHIDFQFV